MARVFVSYSGRSRADKDFAARLLARIKEQGLDPWIFEDRGSEVPLGADIRDHCRKKIRKADLFVAVVSESSLRSPATQDEVAYALDALDAGEVLPIVTVPVAADWPQPYSRLLLRKHLPAGRLDDDAIEVFLEDLCRAVGATYAPPDDPVRRLPLIRRLTAEVRRATSSQSEYEVGNFTRVRARAQEAAEAYAEGRVSNAYSLVDTLNADLRKWYAGTAFYYPRLILGVLLLETGHGGRSEVIKARTTFESMLADPELSNLVDENLHAALAAAQYTLQDYSGATRSYRHAAEIVRARGEVDGDILHNLLMCRLVGGSTSDDKAFDLDAWMPPPGSPAATADPYLRERLEALTAACRAQEGDLGPLRALLALTKADRKPQSDILVRVAQDLACNPAVVADSHTHAFVLELHEHLIAGLPPADRSVCLVSQATLHYMSGQYDEAMVKLRAAQVGVPPHPRFHVEEFWCLMHLGRVDEATVAARRASSMRLDDGVLSNPSAARQFQYFRGFGAWLVQERDLAESDFRDSGYAASMAYQTIADRHIPRAEPLESRPWRRALSRLSGAAWRTTR